MGPCLWPLFHGPEEQGPCPWPSDHCQLSPWTLTPLPQRDRCGQGQGYPDNPDPYPHLHPRGLELSVELEGSPNPPDTPSPKNNGLERREGGSPKALGREGGWTGSGSLVSPGRRGYGPAGAPRHPQSPTFPSPVGGKHSLLPCLHGDRAQAQGG